MNYHKLFENDLRILLLLIGMQFVTFVSFAQDQLLIHGIIKNKITQLPIERVNVQINNTRFGTSTDKKGVFNLKVDKFPVVLSITHVSYYGKQVVISQIPFDSILIFLSPKTVTLSETEITGGIYNVFGGLNQEIIDYDFLDTKLLILTYNYNLNKYKLILTNESFDTICAKDISELINPKSLFKDCMGNCHLLTSDSAYQIYSLNKSIYLIYATCLPEFLNILGNCLFETQTYLAFKGETNKKVKLEYTAKSITDLPSIGLKNDEWKHLFYFINKKTREKIILDQIYEWKKKQDAFKHAMFVYNDPLNKRFFGDILRSEESMFFKPSFQTVKLINDTIYYFNHLKSQIDIYSENLHLLKNIKIEYQNKDNWIPVIITDKLKNKSYTIFKTGAMYSLAEINLHDGSIKEVTKIEKLFPQKIKVNNGRLYFLFRDLTGIWDKRRLYQKQLSNY